MSVTLLVSLDVKLSTRLGNRTHYIMTMSKKHTIGHLMVKMRRKIKGINPNEAIYLMINDTMPTMSTTLSKVEQNGTNENGVIECSIMCESAFGAWSKSFVRAEIEASDIGCFIARIFYNYYFVVPYKDERIFRTLEEAKHWILEERTGGIMRYLGDAPQDLSQENKEI
jgi:hypothetical protein